jgi:hypothetical protein
VVTNDGERPFNTDLHAGVAQGIEAARAGHHRPGVHASPGDTVRTHRQPGAQGARRAAADETTNYSLFLNDTVFTEAGMTLSIVLRTW